VALCGLACLLGCQTITKEFQSFNGSKLAFWNKDKPNDGSAARTMVALWSDSAVFGPGQVPTRGLGGRMYFYDEKHRPMKVDGELVVYAYDDEKAREANRPARKYVFRADEFQNHLSESDFGPSYSVWLPWDKIGNESKSISLVPVFKTESGRILVADHSRNLLPGQSEGLKEKTTTFELSQKQQRAATDVRPVSFDDDRDSSEGTPKTQRAGIRRKSIPVPNSMRQRLMSAREDQPVAIRATPWQDVRKLTGPTIERRDLRNTSDDTAATNLERSKHSVREEPASPPPARRPIRPRQTIFRVPAGPDHEPVRDPDSNSPFPSTGPSDLEPLR
jgi:hypothetical protein